MSTRSKFATPAAGALYRAIDDAYHLQPWEEALLVEALKALDRAEQARQAIGTELTVASRSGEPKAHPLLLVERDARAAFARMMRQLGLEETELPKPVVSHVSSFPRGRAGRAKA